LSENLPPYTGTNHEIAPLT